MIDQRTDDFVLSGRSRPNAKRSDTASIAVGIVLGAIGLTWLAVSVSSPARNDGLQAHPGANNIDFTPAADGVRPPSQTEINNNRIAAMGFPANLDGTAVLYPVELDKLVAPDGRFRTDLSLRQMARILQVDSSTISKNHLDNEIDPDATIFKVVVGRATEKSKAIARNHRKSHEPTDLLPNGGLGEFTRTSIAFALNQVITPDDERKTILEAISRSARAFMPAVGDLVRAAGVSREEIESGGFFIGWGNLPLESRRIVPAGSDVEGGADP